MGLGVLLTVWGGGPFFVKSAASVVVAGAGRSTEIGAVTARVKELESQGWSFEAADASFELLLRQEVDEVPPASPCQLVSYRVIVDHGTNGEVVAQATVKVDVAGQRVIATAEGNGPVNALDAALRQALGAHLPWLENVELSDYKVRILPGTHGTDAVTRVLVDTTDGTGSWTTVGVHGNVVEASWLALLDAMIYAALRHHGVASTA